MEAKACMVTGASSGLGLATATVLARRAQNVVMICRDRIRGEEARAAVASSGGTVTVELALVDLSSPRAIREFVGDFERDHQRLDVLITNAAVFNRTRTLTTDGLEVMYATNHLGPFPLTNLLLDLLRRSAPPG